MSVCVFQRARARVCGYKYIYCLPSLHPSPARSLGRARALSLSLSHVSPAEKAALTEATSAEGFKAVMTAKFGDKYDAVVAQTVQLQKKYLSPDTQKLFDGLPNNVLGGVYELTENMRKAHADEVAALKKEYGVVETGAQGEGDKGGGINLQNIEDVRKDLRQQIIDLDKRPHSSAEKKALTDKLHATYSTAK